MDSHKLIEETRSGHTGYFPENLPARPDPPPPTRWNKFMERFWSFSLSSYSIIHTPNQAARLRHMSMVAILLLRSGMSALSILSAVIKGRIAAIVIYSLLAVLGLWFTATCLAIIGDSRGDGQIKGFLVVS